MRVKAHKYLDHLFESIEKNRSVFSPDDKLPSPRTEAKALLRMVGRNGNGSDNLESMRALIQVGDEVKKLMFRRAHDKEQVERILQFRERVLVVFDELTAKQERVVEGLALRQEKKALRRSRFLAKRQEVSIPTGVNLSAKKSLLGNRARVPSGYQSSFSEHKREF